jgi:hypothetical protein
LLSADISIACTNLRSRPVDERRRQEISFEGVGKGKAAESGADRGGKETITHVYDVVVHLSAVPASALGPGLREEKAGRMKSVFLLDFAHPRGASRRRRAEEGRGQAE